MLTCGESEWVWKSPSHALLCIHTHTHTHTLMCLHTYRCRHVRAQVARGSGIRKDHTRHIPAQQPCFTHTPTHRVKTKPTVQFLPLPPYSKPLRCGVNSPNQAPRSHVLQHVLQDARFIGWHSTKMEDKNSQDKLCCCFASIKTKHHAEGWVTAYQACVSWSGDLGFWEL